MDLILARQQDFIWKQDYVPAIMAVPRKAPRSSCRLYIRLLGRIIHTLSRPERVFTLPTPHVLKTQDHFGVTLSDGDLESSQHRRSSTQ